MHPHRCIYRDKPAPYRLAFLLFLFRFQTLRASAIKALRQAVSEAPKTYASRTAVMQLTSSAAVRPFSAAFRMKPRTSAPGCTPKERR